MKLRMIGGDERGVRASNFLASSRSVITNRLTGGAGRAAIACRGWRSLTADSASAWRDRAANSLAFWRSAIFRRLRAEARRAALSFTTWRLVSANYARAWMHRVAASSTLWRLVTVDRVDAGTRRTALSFATWGLATANYASAWTHRAVASFALWRAVIAHRVRAGTHRTALSVAAWRLPIANYASLWTHRAAGSSAWWRVVLAHRVGAGTRRAAMSLRAWRITAVYGVSAWTHRSAHLFTAWRSALAHGFSRWAARGAISFASSLFLVNSRVVTVSVRVAISLALHRSLIAYRASEAAHAWAISFAAWRSFAYALIAQIGRTAISFPSYRYFSTGLTVAAVLVPLFVVAYQSFLTLPFSASNARLGLDAYRFVFADKDFAVAFGTTLLLGAGMVLIAVPLGAALAFVMVRTDIPGRFCLESLIMLLIFVPAVVLAFGYVAALGPRGILSAMFTRWTGAPQWNLYSLPSLIAIAGLTHVPHAYLCVAAALRSRGSDAEEAASSAGAKPWRIACGVSLPMAMPAILFAGVLVFLLGFELFGLPLVLGGPQDRLVLSTYLYKLSKQTAVSPYQLMAAVALIIAALALPLVFILRLLLNETQRPLALRAKGVRSARLKLGGWRWPAFLAIVLWLAVTALVPLTAMALQSFVARGSEGMALPQALTLDHYRALLKHVQVGRSIINTLGIGLAGGAAAIVIYSAIALAIHRWRSSWARAVGYAVMLPRAMPGLVAGLALLWAFQFFAPLAPFRQTMVSVWLAYTFVWLAYGVQLMSGMLGQVDPQLEDVARSVGATEARARFDVTMPIVRNSILAGWVLICLIFVREYSTGIYLLAPGTELMGSLLVSLWGQGALDLLSALSVLHVAIIGAGLFIANRLGVHLHG